MAKARRLVGARTAKKKPAKPTSAARTRPAAPLPAASATATADSRGSQRRATKVVPPPGQRGTEQPAAASPAPRKPAYYEAIALYESGVRGLQRHDYDGAATAFRSVLERYPEERELHERARLYLRVCERETARRPAAPQTPQERVYAATVALNAGDHAGALDHLNRALEESPDNDHAHYMMAVTLSSRGQIDEALEHLRQAIGLNPENRALARQDPDLDGLRDHDSFREVLDTPAARRRPRPRR
jgi:tetratricopeptide (TPR) repeat protein